MGLSAQDFVVAFRALSSRACPPSAIRKALRVQSSRIVKGRRLTLSESLVEAHAVSPLTAGELASAAPVHLRGDPDALSAAGEIFLSTETASEVELDRIIDSLTRPVDPRTLTKVPVPASLAGYDVSWEVGRSSTGSVYRGTKLENGAHVAIKVFRKEAFATDAARVAFLERMAAGPADDGAGLIKVVEARDVEGHAVVIQEFVEGTPMDALLADRRVSLRRGFEIVGRAAEIVAPVHGKGIAHGRLSARGIMVQSNDHPKIDGPHHREGITPADDVAVLGAVLYEIAAGTPPYGGFRSHVLKPPSSHNPACAGAAERIILKALARDPARRYPDAAALAEDIGRYLRHEEVTADVPASAAAPPTRSIVVRKPRRWAWKAAAAAAAILILMTLVAVLNPGAAPGVPPTPSAPSVKAPPPASAPAPVPPPAAPKAPPAGTRLKELAAKGPLKPNEEIDFQFRATGLLAKREFDELDRLAEEALVRGPESSWAHYFRAIVALERRRDADALKHADRALALGMNRATLYELRFDLRLVRAEYRLALEELARLYPKETVSLANQEILRLGREIERDPTHAAALVRRGALLFHRGMPGRSIEDFRRAVAAGESRADYFLAMALKEEDQPAEAAEAVRRFLAAHASLPGATEAKAFLESLPN